ncbi:MAG TPA: hypothetical protein VFL94_05085 [Actinomycetales bacterium]|nr:hypothetical protein [Actinomycetales bacterium]
MSTEPTDGAAGSETGIESWVRDILRCPRCRAELKDGTGPGGGPELVCTSPECGLAYRVDEGIPVLLVDEARETRG